MNDIVYAGRQEADQPGAWQIMYCLEGSGIIRCGQEAHAYQKGDAVVLPPADCRENIRGTGFEGLFLLMLAPTLPIKEAAVIRDENGPFLRNAFEAALYHFSSPGPEAPALLTAYGNLISCYLAAGPSALRHSRVVESIEQSILAHYADPAYALDAQLRALPFNYDYLRKLFQKEMGVTPHQYLTSIRLQAAATALLSGSQAAAMADIARQCGFREPLYFSRMFKKKYGCAPSFYAQSLREGTVIPPEPDA